MFTLFLFIILTAVIVVHCWTNDRLQLLVKVKKERLRNFIHRPILHQANCCPRRRTFALQDSDSDSDAHSSASLKVHNDVHIRDCTYGEIGQVVDIIVNSFYESSVSPWKQMYWLSELNRLQQSFAHPRHRLQHRMLVAALRFSSTTTSIVKAMDMDIRKNERKTTSFHHNHKKDVVIPPSIIGYIDVDDRPPNQPTGFQNNPRPYLSDLCIDPQCRRSGVAKALVNACECLCRDEMKRDELFVRVETKNAAAVALYESIGYCACTDLQMELTPIGIYMPARRADTILLLRKDLTKTSETISSSEGVLTVQESSNY